jgi:putative membrane protein
MKLLTNLFVNGLAVGLAAYLLPSVAIETWQALLVATVVLGVLNTLVRPILKLISLPITILTLGLFSLVINGLMVWLTSNWVSGFTVENFWWAIGFSIVLSMISTFLSWISRE